MLSQQNLSAPKIFQFKSFFDSIGRATFYLFLKCGGNHGSPNPAQTPTQTSQNILTSFSFHGTFNFM